MRHVAIATVGQPQVSAQLVEHSAVRRLEPFVVIDYDNGIGRPRQQ
jgi:hypothetical protein